VRLDLEAEHGRMSEVNRIWIELEIGSDGPSGTTRDRTGREASFSGWLELIAIIQTPLEATREQPPADVGSTESTA
jgi:hypothetical protein